MPGFSLEGGQTKAFKVEQTAEDDVFVLRRQGDVSGAHFLLRKIKGSEDFSIEDPASKKKHLLSKKHDFLLWNDVSNCIKKTTEL